MLNTLREYDEGSLDGSCQCPLAGAVTISVPYDMNLPNKALGTAFGRLVYDKRFVQGLMPKIEAFLSRCGGGQSSFPKRLVSCSDDILAFPAASPLDITTSSLTSWRSLLLCHSQVVSRPPAHRPGQGQVVKDAARHGGAPHFPYVWLRVCLRLLQVPQNASRSTVFVCNAR